MIIVSEIEKKLIEAGVPKTLDIDEKTKAKRVKKPAKDALSISFKKEGNKVWYEIESSDNGGIIV
jgi:hypothetical protein